MDFPAPEGPEMTRRVGIVFKGRVRRIFRLDIFFSSVGERVVGGWW